MSHITSIWGISNPAFEGVTQYRSSAEIWNIQPQLVSEVIINEVLVKFVERDTFSMYLAKHTQSKVTSRSDLLPGSTKQYAPSTLTSRILFICLPMFNTTLPDTRGAAPPYPELRPMLIGHNGTRCSFAALTIACTSATLGGAITAEAKKKSCFNTWCGS